MSDIVETLRAAAQHPYNGHGPKHWLNEAADEIERLYQSLHDTVTQTQEQADEIIRLRAALRNVMIGGNHLAQVLGIGHLAAGSSYETALEFYGPGPNYDVWCCWNAIMEARAALKESGDE